MKIEQMKIPMVEIFETVEGEGTKAGFLTTFVRLFNCNLRCTWCDTKYSYAPFKPRFYSTIQEIVDKVQAFGHTHVCLTGGEPLMHGQKSLSLIQSISEIDFVKDIHIETNGAIDLSPFAQLREAHRLVKKKVRFIIDYKLPSSGETDKMIHKNFDFLNNNDEIKFVIASEEDYELAKKILSVYHKKGIVLFSPVWDMMKPTQLVHNILRDKLVNVKLNLQLHKIIWGPDVEGV